jgi:primosomal protein N' (replication factor Y) (superfamily II helicase)
MSNQGKYADVILPLPLGQVYSYLIPVDILPSVEPGKRVIVQFGPRKLYTGIVRRILDKSPGKGDIKPILEVLDENPLVNETQMKFWEWMSGYYLCATGEVFRAALPGGLKLESESKILPNEDFDPLELTREHLETLFYSVRSNPGLSIRELSALCHKENIINDIRKLIDLEAVIIEERLIDSLRVKKEKVISLATALLDEQEAQKCLDRLASAPKQQELLAEVISRSLDKNGDLREVQIPLSALSKSHSSAAYKALTVKNYLVRSERIQGAVSNSPAILVKPSELSSAQSAALNSIKANFSEKEVVLLHGLTSSGKTEIYIHLIQEAVASGNQVLYLLPEIALTSQIVTRLKKVFGDMVGIYHSRFSDAERVEVYRKMAGDEKKRYKVILGVRSAIFLPFDKLGLIIVDEEHENTFKQFDPAPRYNARDSSIVLAALHGGKVLLGTATPSIESYSNAKSGKYGLVKLTERFNQVLLPEIRIADISDARKRHQMKSVFTPALINAIGETLENGKQVILFQNRRGFSSYIMDETCGWIPKCKLCDVSLTYHRFRNTLECHYCGYTRKLPNNCESCGSTRLSNRGFGTEQVEDEIALIFPGAKVGRLDLDTSRTRNSYEKILESFGNGSLDILVGTQMLSKGLDFENVALVGILDADQMLNFPDFRAYERSFQLMAQVSGRAGRKDKQGNVIIQTTDPLMSIIGYVRDNDYEAMFREQIEERQAFNYPPFVRMIRITLRHKELQTVKKASELLADSMRIVFGKRVLGPQQPLVGKISNYYLLNILLKVEKKSSFERARKLLSDIIAESYTSELMKGVRIQPDVDPY